ncbi:DNA glycosylase [Nocardioides gansuensis]|uniref:DNA-(apurinic or apyrimidinic site) lyase n=1 Tax=Nocardioides gansuensis TaxID=2138300 RepID=A0A2T8F8Q3_9ACTN|nr:DNA-formamidopyrimidine glycosylase family protein [Nocardioides gansuensis]PVG82047.1 DNA glycosylase [Nocardioides gansuensis]
MPEGDTVHRTARMLDRALSGDLLTRTDFRVPQLATVDLSGARVEDTVARGKHLLTRIAGDERWTLHTHLKMEGAWRVHRPGERWQRPSDQARVVLETPRCTAVGFSLGVELLPTAREDDAVGHLGPDLLGPGWDADEAVRRLLAEPGRPVHEALLDQRLLAGIGNLYAAELCFLAGVRPDRPVGEVPDLARLVRRAHQVLTTNVGRSTQSTTGDLRRGRTTWVYRQRACRRCGTAVEVEMQGPDGRERAAYWCPSCQPA